MHLIHVQSIHILCSQRQHPASPLHILYISSYHVEQPFNMPLIISRAPLTVVRVFPLAGMRWSTCAWGQKNWKQWQITSCVQCWAVALVGAIVSPVHTFQWNTLIVDWPADLTIPCFDGPSDLSREIVGAIVDSLAECYGCPFLTGWLRAEVSHTQLAGQELCLLHVDRPAEGYSSSHSTDQPRTVLSPIHINKLS